MKTIKKIWSILLVCGLILVPTISVSAAEQEPEKVEVSFFNENGEEVSVSEEIADSFMEQLDVDKEVNIVSDKNLRASCTHIPCNQVKTTLPYNQRDCLFLSQLPLSVHFSCSQEHKYHFLIC